MKKSLLIFMLQISFSFAAPPTIHDIDNRKILKKSELSKYSNAIAGMYSYYEGSPDESRLIKEVDGTYSLDTYKFQDSVNVCEEHPFHNQDVAASCTAFLISPDQVMTAGHCLQDFFPLLENTEIGDIGQRIIFGNKRDGILESDIYSVTEIIKARKTNFFGDYAILKLDRPVKGIKPLNINKSYFNDTSSRLITIGHQEGLVDLVSASSGKYKDDEGLSSAIKFISDLDINSGASGSPVINEESGEVVGIIVTTTHQTEDNDEYILDEAKACYLDKVYGKNVYVTGVQRIDSIFDDSQDRVFHELLFSARFEETEVNPMTIGKYVELHGIKADEVFYVNEDGLEYKTLMVGVLHYYMYKDLGPVKFLLENNIKIDYFSMEFVKSLSDETILDLFEKYN